MLKEKVFVQKESVCYALWHVWSGAYCITTIFSWNYSRIILFVKAFFAKSTNNSFGRTVFFGDSCNNL